jgi:hypothetical protein
MDKRTDSEFPSFEAVFDDVQRPIRVGIADVLLTLNAESATLGSLAVENGVLTLTISAQVKAISFKGKPADLPAVDTPSGQPVSKFAPEVTSTSALGVSERRDSPSDSEPSSEAFPRTRDGADSQSVSAGKGIMLEDFD